MASSGIILPMRERQLPTTPSLETDKKSLRVKLRLDPSLLAQFPTAGAEWWASDVDLWAGARVNQSIPSQTDVPILRVPGHASPSSPSITGLPQNRQDEAGLQIPRELISFGIIQAQSTYLPMPQPVGHNITSAQNASPPQPSHPAPAGLGDSSFTTTHGLTSFTGSRHQDISESRRQSPAIDELPELDIDPGEGHEEPESNEFGEAFDAMMVARMYEGDIETTETQEHDTSLP